ncbi:MAG: STAS domain-containing protein [Gammaproteobacteria bacterium]
MNNDDTDLLRLENASIRECVELKRTLVERLDASGPVNIHAGSIERIDAATLQLLAAFVRELGSASRPVKWISRSEVLDCAARSLGLAAALALTPETGGA